MKGSFSVFMLAWEYPPQITGGLGIAVAGMSNALASRGVRVSLMLPHLTGGEAQIPGIDLVDVTSEFRTLSPQERSRMGTALARNWKDHPSFSAYASQLYHEAVGTASWTAAPAGGARTDFRITPGYGPSIHRDIHDFAALAGILARRMTIDVVHAHDWVTYPAGEAAARAAGVPLICHVHATEYDRSGDAMNPAVFELERRGFEAANIVVTVSHYTAGIVRDRYGIPHHKISVVHNGMEPGLGLAPVAAKQTVKATKPVSIENETKKERALIKKQAAKTPKAEKVGHRKTRGNQKWKQ